MLVSNAARRSITIVSTIFLAQSFTLGSRADNAPEPLITASGAGMTSAQLEATRPILSALKSVDEAKQAVDQIRDKAKEMLHLCTDTVPTSDEALIISGPFSKSNGKYYNAPKWKLLEIKKDIDKQKEFLAENLGANQQDKRTLRASEPTRQKIEALRVEARTLLVQMNEDTNKINTLLSGGAQADIAMSAKALIHSTEAVEAKLKEMEKVLKKEQ